MPDPSTLDADGDDDVVCGMPIDNTIRTDTRIAA